MYNMSTFARSYVCTYNFFSHLYHDVGYNAYIYNFYIKANVKYIYVYALCYATNSCTRE